MQPPTIYAGRSASNDPTYAGSVGLNGRQLTPNRQPLGNLDQNILGSQGASGYGLSGGAKVGKLSGGHFRGPENGSFGRTMPHVFHR